MADSWRWRNVPIPEAHLGGLVVGAALHLVRPWSMPVDPAVAQALGGGSVLVGVGVVWWAVRAAGDRTLETPAVLVTDGPYRYSRNPMYVGWTVGYLGLALLGATVWPLVLLLVVAALVHRDVRREEQDLENRFGAEYRRYRSEVRRYL